MSYKQTTTVLKEKPLPRRSLTVGAERASYGLLLRVYAERATAMVISKIKNKKQPYPENKQRYESFGTILG